MAVERACARPWARKTSPHASSSVVDVGVSPFEGVQLLVDGCAVAVRHGRTALVRLMRTVGEAAALARSDCSSGLSSYSRCAWETTTAGTSRTLPSDWSVMMKRWFRCPESTARPRASVCTIRVSVSVIQRVSTSVPRWASGNVGRYSPSVAAGPSRRPARGCSAWPGSSSLDDLAGRWTVGAVDGVPHSAGASAASCARAVVLDDPGVAL